MMISKDEPTVASKDKPAEASVKPAFKSKDNPSLAPKDQSTRTKDNHKVTATEQFTTASNGEPAVAPKAEIPIIVEFSGGLEMFFSNKRKHKLSIPTEDDKAKAVTIAWLINYLCEEVMKDSRKEMFVLDGHVRPGILVLINDADWELEGEATYALQPDDNILFVSTLHGG